MNTNEEKLKNISYSGIKDKNIAHQDFLYKLIIIGDTGVGKSCLLARIMDNDFKIEHQVTIGDKIVKLQIWDTAGQESFRSITRIFYRGAHCVFLTYDITREETFNNVGDWLKEVKQHANPDILIYLIGNFCDLEDDREISREKAIEFCRENGIEKFFETSAKTGDHVEEVFSLAARELYLQQKEQADEEQREQEEKAKELAQKQRQEKVKLKATTTKEKQEKPKGCC
ncbi:hypothetical protein FGO68_gene8329 [Halteria grandinella]|uniref:Uncharacterized protein n=1 Tax=Halteria grandinella TaxID=5974 RepID=A0A8J8NKE1_HALGN|nr:hypothetical protein FGO68_gene8329 [Halteria grandinella]